MKLLKSFFSDLSNLEKTLLVILGVLVTCMFCFGAVRLMQVSLFNIGESVQSNNPVPTQKTRPNYRQMLEANSFVYSMNDGDGDPIYVSPCGCVATVKPDYIGFGVYVTDDNCPIEDLGAIVTVMYPSGVFDFIISNMNSAVVQDILVQGTAAGYKISMDFDRTDFVLTIIVYEPR